MFTPLSKSTAKSFSSQFKRFVPGRPCTPLYAPVSKRVLLDEPGCRGVSPPPPLFTWLTLREPLRENSSARFVMLPPGTWTKSDEAQNKKRSTIVKVLEKCLFEIQ